MSLPYLSMAVGDMIERNGWAAESRNGAYGDLNFTLTVYGSTTVVLSYGPISDSAICDFISGLTIRSNVALTASPLNGVPSWNFTSLRNEKVYSSAVGLTSHFSARPGTNTPGFGSRTS